MQKLSRTSDGLAGRAAMLAGAAAIAGGVTQIVHSQRHAGAYYLAVGYLLVNDAIERRPSVAPQPAGA